MNVINFTVHGVPIPKGSTKAFVPKGWKRPIVTADNSKTKPWANLVKLMAQNYAPESGPWQGAVHLTVHFFMPRPKSLPKKVQHHLKKPDLDKLLRTIKDALKGVVYCDDAQVTDVVMCKRYGEQPGVRITAACPEAPRDGEKGTT